MNNFNPLTALFESAFNIKAAFTMPGPPSLQQLGELLGINGFSNLQSRGDHPGELGDVRKSWMGTPVLFQMTFSEMANARTIDPTGKVVRYSYSRFDLPAATLVDFSRPKKIVETDVASGWGTVNELYSLGDWEIKMRGLCLDEPDGRGGYTRTAQQQKEALIKFGDICQSIPVEGSLFSDHDITHIVIKDIAFRQVEGKPWVIPFELDAKSEPSPTLTTNSGKLKRKA